MHHSIAKRNKNTFTFTPMHEVWSRVNSVIQKLRKYHVSEVLMILLLILVFNNYLGNPNKTIKSDGVGYYDYLVSIFIEDDIDRRTTSMAENSGVYERLIDLQNGNVAFGIYLPYQGKMVNKYSCGTALLLSPFFLTTICIQDQAVTGYEPPFQKSVFYAALFYLFVALVFFRLTLETYEIKPWLIVTSQVLMLLGTAIPHYAYFDASFSHIYSLAAVSAFVFAIRKLALRSQMKHLVLAGALLGLIFLLRQVNLLVVLFIPFLTGSWGEFRDLVKRILARPLWLTAAGFAFLMVVSIQFILWHLQTGDAILYSYRQEGFDFLHPEVMNLLFSYKKGLFVYYPILAVCTTSSLVLLFKSQFFKFFSWFIAFGALVYVFSAWWSWDYGACFGQRPFIEYYPLFFLLFALSLSQVGITASTILLSVAALCVPFTLIQIRQYQNYIFHWYKMDREKYWKVFMKTDDRYRYWTWLSKEDEQYLQLNHSINLGDVSSGTEPDPILYQASLNKLAEHGGITTIRVKFTYPFKETDEEKLVLGIVYENGEHAYIHGAPLMQFCKGEFGPTATGYFDFNIGYPDMDRAPRVELQLRSNTIENPVVLQDLSLEFYRPK